MSRFHTKRLRTGYAILSWLFLILQGWAITQYLAETSGVLATVLALGYPLYVLKILAVAKFLGIVAIATRWSVALNEWAYAGFMFEALGALASHLYNGAPLTFALVPVVSLTLGLASYWTWKQLLRHTGVRRKHYGFGLPPADPAQSEA